MHIVVFSMMYSPDNFKINDIVLELIRQGHSVKVITGLPDYATSHIPSEYRWFRKRHEKLYHYEVRRLPIIARRHGAFFRALNYLSYVISGSLYALFCRKKGTDAVFVYETSPVFQAIPALIFKKLAKKPLTLYCCDVWPACIRAWNIKEDSFLYRFSLRASRFIYRRCDTVAVTSRPFIPYLHDVCGVEETRMTYLPQHAEDLYTDICGVYEDDGQTDFLFAGNVGAVQDVECIIKAASHIPPDRAFKVHIVGAGSRLNACKKLAEKRGVQDRVTFHGRHPLSRMPGYYKMADCMLLTLRGGDMIGETLPAKAQSYLSVGKPIVGAIDGAGQEMIREADCGECVPAGDDAALAAAMLKVIDDPALYREKGRQGRRFFEENYTKALFMQRLLALLDKDGQA